MLNNPPEEVLRAFVKLKNDNNFEIVMKWLNDCEVEEAVASTTVKDDKEEHWADGRVQALTAILKVATNAREILESIEKGKNRMHQGSGTGAFS